MEPHELHIKLKVDTTEAEEAIARVKKQVAQNELQQFKQRVLALVERCEEVLETSGQGTIEDLACTEKCLHDIKQLCQEEVNRDNT